MIADETAKQEKLEAQLQRKGERGWQRGDRGADPGTRPRDVGACRAESRAGAAPDRGVTGGSSLLTALAYYAGAIDGLAGPETRSGIAAFQRRQAQPATGAVTAGLLDRPCACVS